MWLRRGRPGGATKAEVTRDRGMPTIEVTSVRTVAAPFVVRSNQAERCGEGHPQGRLTPGAARRVVRR